MISLKLPKEVLDLFPMWEYRCRNCGTIYGEPKQVCTKCGTAIDLIKDRIPPRFMKNHKAMSKYAHKILASKLSPEQRKLLFKYFTEILNSGWEDSGGTDVTDNGEWTGTSVDADQTLEVSATEVHHGNYSLKAITLGVSGKQARVYKDFDAITTCHLRFYLYIDSTTGSGAIFFGDIYDFYACGIGITGAGRNLHLGYRDGWDGYTDTSSTTLALQTWYCIELKKYDHATSGEIRVYLDGTEVADLAQTGIDTATASDNNKVNVGQRNNWRGNTTTYIDCVVVADTYVGTEAAAQTYTKTWTTDALFKKLGIPKTLSVDTAFQKQDIPKAFGLDATFQKSFSIQKQIDCLFKRFGILKSFAVDTCFGALITQTISRQIDVLLKKLDATKTFGLDVYFGPVEAETYAKTFALDAIFAYKVRLPELWLDENGKIVLNISKPYTWVGT